VGYNYGNISSTGNYILRSTLSYTLHFASTTEGATYNWTSDAVSWDESATTGTKKLTYTQGKAPAIAWATAANISDITPTPVDNKVVAATGGKLTFVDKAGNSVVSALTIADGGAITAAAPTEVTKGSGVAESAVPALADFTPDYATLYLPIRDKKNNVWIEQVIKTFKPIVKP
jgi:hypothetical protein